MKPAHRSREENLKLHNLKKRARMLGLVPPHMTISKRDLVQIFPTGDNSINPIEAIQRA
jgi:hypothetical protein